MRQLYFAGDDATVFALTKHEAKSISKKTNIPIRKLSPDKQQITCDKDETVFFSLLDVRDMRPPHDYMLITTDSEEKLEEVLMTMIEIEKATTMLSAKEIVVLIKDAIRNNDTTETRMLLSPDSDENIRVLLAESDIDFTFTDYGFRFNDYSIVFITHATKDKPTEKTFIIKGGV